jgi:hypothetical protein
MLWRLADEKQRLCGLPPPPPMRPCYHISPALRIGECVGGMIHRLYTMIFAMIANRF